MSGIEKKRIGLLIFDGKSIFFHITLYQIYNTVLQWNLPYFIPLAM